MAWETLGAEISVDLRVLRKALQRSQSRALWQREQEDGAEEGSQDSLGRRGVYPRRPNIRFRHGLIMRCANSASSGAGARAVNFDVWIAGVGGSRCRGRGTRARRARSCCAAHGRCKAIRIHLKPPRGYLFGSSAAHCCGDHWAARRESAEC